MHQTFKKRIATLTSEVEKFGKPVSEIVILASLLEEEASTSEDRRIVSGILWKRLSMGMLLQVDATFQYINGKGSLELTLDDLKIDSPYNTYKYKGLPPTPISNPGLDSIRAAVIPTKTNYLYYLSERDGTMHYATTFAEHLRNKARYLRI